MPKLLSFPLGGLLANCETCLRSADANRYWNLALMCIALRMVTALPASEKRSREVQSCTVADLRGLRFQFEADYGRGIAISQQAFCNELSQGRA
jgi:hypothetical protein